MPTKILTEEQRIKKNIANKKYRDKKKLEDPDYILKERKQHKEYRDKRTPQQKEKRTEYNKTFRKELLTKDPDYDKKKYANRDKSYYARYYQNRREDPVWVEEQRIKMREYKKTLDKKDTALKRKAYFSTYLGRRSHMLCEWKKKANLKETPERLDEIFELHYHATNCDLCDKEFNDKTWKCMEHHHASGHFRGIRCNTCNAKLTRIDNLTRQLLLDLHRYFNRNSEKFIFS